MAYGRNVGASEVSAGGGAPGELSNGILDGRSWAPHSLVKDPLTWRSAVYMLLSLGLGISWLVILTVGVSLVAGLLVIWVGVPLAALLMVIWRYGARAERRIMKAAFGVTIPDPYRRLPDYRERGPIMRLLARWRSMAGDVATWKDLLYLALLFPVSVAEFAISCALWTTVLAFVLMPLLVQAIGDGDVTITFLTIDYHITSPIQAVPLIPVGLAFFLLALYVTRLMAVVHASYARFLLGSSENQQLRRRTAQLQASRARGVDAAEAERRRIERDLHDGAQQQLLAVAMDIGRARAKLDTDPEGARALIEQAHLGAREAIQELRNLARGIYPAILTDRGLDAALSALAARANLSVEVVVDLPTRPPAAVESIAYFVVAESLVNISKYARATQATVTVSRDQQWVVVEVTDNGVGGASAEPGGGLAGLADRAATIDGILTINSPVGGPTVIRADLPCTW